MQTVQMVQSCELIVKKAAVYSEVLAFCRMKALAKSHQDQCA